MNRNTTWAIIKRAFEIIFFGTCFWLIRYWIVTDKDKLDPVNSFGNDYARNMQQFDTEFFYGLLIVFIIGYYLYIATVVEFKKRANGESGSLIDSNRKIICLRIGVLVCMYISLGIAGMTLTNLSDAATAEIFVLPALPIGVGLAPYYVFYKLTNIFTFKYCIYITLVILAITVIGGMAHIPPSFSFLFTTLPVFVTLTKKYKEATNFVKTGRTEDIPT